MSGQVLRIAIQKSGRLSSESLNLLTECGISLRGGRDSNRLKDTALNFPLEILFIRDDDICGFVQDGTVDIGIVGKNSKVESETTSVEVMNLGFSHCRLSIAVPRGGNINSIDDLSGKKIATSYPVTLRKFLKKRSIDASIHCISGSVEVAPSVGLADAICDLVGSGSTLVSNGLVELERVLESQAVLIANSKIYGEKEVTDSDYTAKKNLLQKIIFRIKAVCTASGKKYVVMNVPNDKIDSVIEILPGIRSPSVVPLADKEWSAIHSLVDEAKFWDTVEAVRSLGAQGLVIMPVEKIIK